MMTMVTWGCRGVGAIMGVSVGVGVSGCIGASRDSRYSGSRRGIGAQGVLEGS